MMRRENPKPHPANITTTMAKKKGETKGWTHKPIPGPRTYTVNGGGGIEHEPSMQAHVVMLENGNIDLSVTKVENDFNATPQLWAKAFRDIARQLETLA